MSPANTNLREEVTTSTSGTTSSRNPTQAASQQAQVAAQQAERAVSAAQQKVGDAISPLPSTVLNKTPQSAKSVKSSTTIPPDEMGSDDGTTTAKQKAADAERQRLFKIAQAEAAQRAEAEKARVKAEQEKAKQDAEVAARAAARQQVEAEKERTRQEAIAEQRRKMEEAEKKRRELVARAEAAQRAEAAAAKAKAEAEERKRKEEEVAAAAAKAKADEEMMQRRRREEEERRQREREEAAAKARLKAEAAQKQFDEEERRKKEEEQRVAAAEAKRKAEELAEKLAEEARLKKEEQERAAVEAKRKAEELAEKQAEEVRLKKEQQERAAAEAKRKAEELAKLKAEQARLKKEQEERAAAEARRKAEEAAKKKAEEERLKKEQLQRAAAEAVRKAEEDARKRAEEKARLKKEQEERAAAEAKLKAAELERLGKERRILLEKKRQEEAEASRKKLQETTTRLMLVLSNEQKSLLQNEARLDEERKKAVSEHQTKVLQVLEARASDLKASQLQVSKDTDSLLSTLAYSKSELQKIEQNLAIERANLVAEYQERQKEFTAAEAKRRGEEDAQRQREQRELAALRKVEEEKRRKEGLEAKQRAEIEARKKAEEKKRRLEAIARERRKAEEELRVKNLAMAEKDAAEKRSREQKRQKEITAKAKAAAMAAKRVAKEKKEEHQMSEERANTPVADEPMQKEDDSSSIEFTDDLVSSAVEDESSDLDTTDTAVNDVEKSLDQQLAELTSKIDELERESNLATDETSKEETITNASPDKIDSKNADVASSAKIDSKNADMDSDKSTVVSEKKDNATEMDEEAKKKAKEQEDLRIRSAYLDWCIAYSKKPDMTRIQQFKKNYLLIEEFAKENGKEIKLNEYADCTAAEYERAMKEKAEAKKKEEEEQKKREEEAAAAYKAAVDEASQSFGFGGNKTVAATDESGNVDTKSQKSTIVTGDPDDVWKTGEPTMSMWQPEDEGSMWASEGGASVWESRESREWGEIDESYSALGTVDPDDPEVRRRVRSAYSNWCKEYSKEPDEGRFPRFKTNYLKMEQMAWEQGSEITLNEFADCSPEEYRIATGGGPSEEEERLQRLRIEQEEEAEIEKARRREDRIERLRREQEEEAARLTAKRTVEPVWKVGEPKKRVKDIRVDWDQDETAAMEEVERMALAKAEAAARRVEEARKKKVPVSPASSDSSIFRSSKNDVDRQLRQKAMNDRTRRESDDVFARKEAERRRDFDEEQTRLEEEWAARTKTKRQTDDRLNRQWSRGKVPQDNRNNASSSFRMSPPKAEPSPAFNLGSIFGLGSSMNSVRPPPPPSSNEFVFDPSEPIVKPPGSFEPKVKAPAYDNKAWQDHYIKNYDPTVGNGYRNGASDSVSPQPSGGSYFMDLSDGQEGRSAPPAAVPPSNNEWYEDSLSQPSPSLSSAEAFSSPEGSGIGQRSGVAPDEVELDATPSRYVHGAGSYLDNISPLSNGVSDNSRYSEKDNTSSPPSPSPQFSAAPAVSRSRGASRSGSYLDNLQSQFPERIESAYRDWCQYYGKEASEDRLRIFASNFLAVEKYHRETGVSLILNELADMTSDEFQSKNGKSGP
jgi:hypothetical protein